MALALKRGNHRSMSYVKLIEVGRCNRDAGTFVELDGAELAVFRLGHPPRFIVIDNTCPHAGGNLSAGAVTGSIVTCPWHRWEFDLDSGSGVHSTQAKVTRYPVKLIGQDVYADLDAPM